MRRPTAGCVYLGDFLPAAEWLWRFRGGDVRAVLIEDPVEAQDIVRWAHEKNIRCLRVASSEVLDGALETLGDLDWGLCANFGLILRKRSLDRFRRGVLNIHPGILPGQAGRDPVSRQWRLPSPEFGVTLHWMTERVDAGPIIQTIPLPRDVRFDSPAATTRNLYLLALSHLDRHLASFC